MSYNDLYYPNMDTKTSRIAKAKNLMHKYVGEKVLIAMTLVTSTSVFLMNEFGLSILLAGFFRCVASS